MNVKKIIRCAIYTRKSSEEGLDQDFNSLDAQREACEAYIKSQKAEGWKLLPRQYDDGGHSGGTLERPALQNLIEDIEAGRVDMVVVYKIDRLTRSLSDFAKLIDRLDEAGATFVSVTQSFNTSTSMGRLTLNVLLSFAQFEREVTAERIRDKIAASKKKGMWMGGLVPLGYDAAERSLIINAEEATTVRQLFQLYDELGSITSLKVECDRLEVVSKIRTSKAGRIYGGAPLSRGMIHHLLTNPVYIGEIRHKQERYPGNHSPIIKRHTWDRTQSLLMEAAARKRNQTSAKHPSPLAGKIFDETGDRLTPSHARSGNKRHRYYVSRRLIEGTREGTMDGWRLPALTIERTVLNTVKNKMLPVICNELQSAAANVTQMEACASRLTELQNDTTEDGAGLAVLIHRIDLTPGLMTVCLAPDQVAEAFAVHLDTLSGAELTHQLGFQMRRRGVEARMVIGDETTTPDATFIKAIARSVNWLEEIKSGASPKSIQTREGISGGYFRKMMKLAFLAPPIVEAITKGRQPTELTLEKIVSSAVPQCWEEQRQLFGFKA